jgi:hypothetical protein
MVDQSFSLVTIINYISMKHKLKTVAKKGLLSLFLILFSCEDNDSPKGFNVASSEVTKAKKWFNDYEGKGENIASLQNLEYDWSTAKNTKSEDGTETIIVPINELKKDQRDFWEQRLYIYKKGNEDYKALVYEIYTNKYVAPSSQSIDGGDFTGFVSVWDLKAGFVRAAKFENNQVVETGIIEVKFSDRGTTNKAPIEAPCVYADFGDGGCGGKSGGDSATAIKPAPIALREVLVKAPGKASPVEYYGPRSPVIGGSNPVSYTSPNGGGSSSGGSTSSITTQAQFIAAIESTAPNAYNFTFVQIDNTITVTASIGLVPFASITLEIIEAKVGDKYVVQKVVTNLTGVTTGLGWSQTSFSQTTIGNTTTVAFNGIASAVMPINGLGTIYSYPMSYSIKVDNTNGKIISGTRVK